jgi:hypothetical protein
VIERRADRKGCGGGVGFESPKIIFEEQTLPPPKKIKAIFYIIQSELKPKNYFF